MKITNKFNLKKKDRKRKNSLKKKKFNHKITYVSLKELIKKLISKLKYIKFKLITKLHQEAIHRIKAIILDISRTLKPHLGRLDDFTISMSIVIGNKLS